MLVPFKSQVQVNEPEIRNDCLPACASMVMGAYLPTISQYYEETGIEPGGFQKAGDAISWMLKHGLKANWDIGDGLISIKRWVDAKKPVIVLVSYKPLSDAGITCNRGDFTHFLVVVGYDADNIYVHDPYCVYDKGANLKIPNNLFMTAWGTVPIEFGPNYGAIVPEKSLGDTMVMPFGNYRVNTAWLNVRAGPSTDYKVIKGLPVGTIVNVVDITNEGWGRIDIGWVYMQYLTYIGIMPQVLDVSHWEVGTNCRFIDWEIPDLSGIQAVICKCTEGTTFKDKSFGHNRGQCKYDIGMKFGGYHYFKNAVDPIAQADFFYASLKGDLGEIIPTLDCEESTDTVNLPAKIKTFLDRFELKSGKKAMIYTSPGWWKSFMTGATWAVNYPLWVAHWNVSTPTIPAPWTEAHLWQYTRLGSIAGVVGDLDFNKVYKLPLT